MRPLTLGVFITELLALIAWLGLTGAAYIRPYHYVPLSEMAYTLHTHVCATGTVVKITPERDGDMHYKLKDPQSDSYIIAEVIPNLQPTGTAPIEGETATACGISRRDPKHLWLELHPVEYWEEAIGHE